MTGLVGSGKSSVAARLADATGGVVIASDRVRKHLYGLAPDERDGAARGLYDDAAKARVYEALLARAEPVTASGRVAILDASYEQETQRRAAIAWAQVQQLPPPVLVETRCERETARVRLVRRVAADTDASDAGPDQLAASESRYEPPRSGTGIRLYTVATDQPGSRDQLRAVAREIRSLQRRAVSVRKEPCRTAPFEA